MQKLLVFSLVFLAICTFSSCNYDSNILTETPVIRTTGSVTQGDGFYYINGMYACSGVSYSNLGVSVSFDNKKWTVPADVNFMSAYKLPDLFNKCSGVVPTSMTQVDINSIPIREIDKDGQVIVGYIYADNYFELYVNGKLVGVDAVPYTSLNSTIVRFRAKRPISYAIKVVDWESNMGLGTEIKNGKIYQPNTGAFIANFSDGTSTNGSWYAQTYYIAPLESPYCVREVGTERVTTDCTNTPVTAGKSYAMHWDVPADWYAIGHKFGYWPKAKVYSEAEIPMNPAYTNFKTQFGDAKFIWTSNMVLDNMVLLRITGN